MGGFNEQAHKVGETAGDLTRQGSHSKLCKIIVAIFVPPLAVVMHKGTLDTDFWLNLLLTLLIFLPGMIHALWIIMTKGGYGL
mmetsp:Transcript_4755/g.11237  ORF Transcript_4755/g.11237 Transcript_4755/m.11237 type:complete len:83 (-) Transcript_4755:204-452(-)